MVPDVPRLILLAASDPGWALATGAGLHARGWSIAWAADAAAAAPAARRTLPDVVIVDEELDGGARWLLDQLRATAATALVPVVAVGREELLPGAQVVLATPVTVDDLDGAARAALTADVTVPGPPGALLADPRRLALLDASGLLADEDDPVFDRITAIAAQLLPATSARVTLVAGDRQVFASRTDRDRSADVEPERSTPLTHSLCQWPVAAKEPLVVGDARADPLLAVNRAVSELGAIAYLGTPLIVDGQALGTLCILDGEPRDWQPEHLEVLDGLAVAAAAHVRVRLAGDARARDAAADAVVALTTLLRRNLATMTARCLDDVAATLDHFAGRLRAAPTP